MWALIDLDIKIVLASLKVLRDRVHTLDEKNTHKMVKLCKKKERKNQQNTHKNDTQYLYNLKR